VGKPSEQCVRCHGSHFVEGNVVDPPTHRGGVEYADHVYLGVTVVARAVLVRADASLVLSDVGHGTHRARVVTQHCEAALDWIAAQKVATRFELHGRTVHAHQNAKAR
jgi:hypothetical protein